MFSELQLAQAEDVVVCDMAVKNCRDIERSAMGWDQSLAQLSIEDVTNG